MSPSPAPTGSQPGKGLRSNTTVTKKSTKELTDAVGENTDVRDKKQAVEFLHKFQYLAPGETPELSMLADTLLRLTHAVGRMPKQTSDGIRAVAILIQDVAADQIAEEIATRVQEKLEGHMQVLREGLEDMREVATQVRDTIGEVKGSIDEVREQSQEAAITTAGTMDELSDQVMMMTEVNARLHRYADGAETREKTAAERQGVEPTTQQPTLTTSYARAAGLHIPTAHLTVISRGETNDRQVLIQRGEMEAAAADGLSDKELVEKANVTLTLMGTQADDAPVGSKFIGAKRLRNGNILYAMNTKEAADWMKKKEAQKAFGEKYGGMTNVRTRLLYAIAEFVPTTFGAGSDFANAQVEDVNKLHAGSLAYSKWIKPENLRSPSQRSAHAILGFTSREEANKALEYGLYMEGRAVQVRKMLPEPKRCLKCQRHGHITTECKATTDTCARCSGQHRTATCNATGPEMLKCANCPDRNAAGHTAADRRCPTFVRETERLQARMPETKYRYYPTNEPKTWRMVDETMGNAREQETAWQQGAAWATQGNDMTGQQQRPAAHFDEAAFQTRWTEVRRRGRQAGPPPSGNGRGTGANAGAQNSGWPAQRLAQYTLPSFFSQANQQGNPQTTNTPWAERDPGEQGPGPMPQFGPGPSNTQSRQPHAQEGQAGDNPTHSQ